MRSPKGVVEEHVPITVEFTYVTWKVPARSSLGCSGGLEMLFSNRRKHSISLPAVDENGEASTLAYLVRYLCKNILKDCRKELFVLDGSMFVTLPEVSHLAIDPDSAALESWCSSMTLIGSLKVKVHMLYREMITSCSYLHCMEGDAHAGAEEDSKHHNHRLVSRNIS